VGLGVEDHLVEVDRLRRREEAEVVVAEQLVAASASSARIGTQERRTRIMA
jgi:hypothetical protein